MRGLLDQKKITHFLEQLGGRVKSPGSLYLVGGATALLEGWRLSTIDIGIKLDPEPKGIFEAIADLKDLLGVNVELASPEHFIPEVPGWRERSRLVGHFGLLTVYHLDAYSQALAKVERGHDQGLTDVVAMLNRELVTPAELRRLFALIVPAMIRYPALEQRAFARKLDEALRGATP